MWTFKAVLQQQVHPYKNPLAHFDSSPPPLFAFWGWKLDQNSSTAGRVLALKELPCTAIKKTSAILEVLESDMAQRQVL